MPGFWLWFETSAIDIPVSWELTVGARGRVNPRGSHPALRKMHKRGWNCVREWVYGCTCSHGASAPTNDRQSCVMGAEPVPGAGMCWGTQLCVALCASIAALQPNWPCQGKAQQHQLMQQGQGGEGSTHLCFHESLPGTQAQGRQLLLLSLVSLSRGNALRSSATSLSSGKCLGARLGARLEPPSQADAQALCGFCARAESGKQLWGSSDSIPLLLPAYPGAVGMLDPTSSSGVKTALNYLSRIVSITQVVLIIQRNLRVPPGL